MPCKQTDLRRMHHLSVHHFTINGQQHTQVEVHTAWLPRLHADQQVTEERGPLRTHTHQNQNSTGAISHTHSQPPTYPHTEKAPVYGPRNLTISPALNHHTDKGRHIPSTLTSHAHTCLNVTYSINKAHPYTRIDTVYFKVQKASIIHPPLQSCGQCHLLCI